MLAALVLAAATRTPLYEPKRCLDAQSSTGLDLPFRSKGLYLDTIDRIDKVVHDGNVVGYIYVTLGGERAYTPRAAFPPHYILYPYSSRKGTTVQVFPPRIVDDEMAIIKLNSLHSLSMSSQSDLRETVGGGTGPMFLFYGRLPAGFSIRKCVAGKRIG
ncbi:MAG: hypothetical protein M3R51_07810 [Candidatus Eremiobacteraeota bacterium]|nr:hypothetical protein [Candidatus Eremiobacteraeota bacterium]